MILGRAGVVLRHVLQVLVVPPGRGGIAGGKRPNLLGLGAGAEVREAAACEFAERGVAFADRLLQPPGNTAARVGEPEGGIDGGRLVCQKGAERIAQPLTLLRAEGFALTATALDGANVFDAR